MCAKTPKLNAALVASVFAELLCFTSALDQMGFALRSVEQDLGLVSSSIFRIQ